jgi:hypothetical protein
MQIKVVIKVIQNMIGHLGLNYSNKVTNLHFIDSLFNIDTIRKRHYEKLCPQKPHYFATRAQKPLKYNYVTTMSSKVQLLCKYTS